MSRAEHYTDPALAELERQIAATREQLGQTVEELAAKVDVPGRAKAKAAETASRFRASAQRAEDRARAATVQAADHVKQGAARGGGHGRHARHAGADAGTSEPGSGPASDRAGAHLATAEGEVSAGARSAEDKERLAYGAAAVGLTAATAGAAVWASRHP